ncbi:protein DpdE [Streptomyces cellulosae]|uniref:protein DpdE n=1 Tax=unclassified Streptomyces TaxID=2593676 RepID=UPI00109EA998|nr:restriction endonuclease subunit R [Streptomyces sp. SID4956]THC47897.1 restriction endonuclease subunit R [Streptomyces sp. Akac8]WSB91007.1 protein DpdE [Streptomyces cellulosae]
MSSGFAVGHLVTFTGAPGIGRVGAVDGGTLRVDFFESVAEPEIESHPVPAAACRRVRLERQTRVFRHNPSTGEWLAGRVANRVGGQYFVRFPNVEFAFPVPESELRVRWDKPVRDPLHVLVSGGNESGFLYNARIPMLRNLVAQRAVSASTPALLAAAAEIYPHQVRAALAVLSDPVQRYLLADEVGLGKTIEAGYVILQTLIDNPQARVVVVAPDSLRRQWQVELKSKFFTDDFPMRVRITSHETPEKWEQYHQSDLVVVDEAHQLVQDRDDTDPTYRALCDLAHSASKLLLLSATPVTSSHTTHLGLLHLLDKDVYKWSEREAFEQRYNHRAELATHLYSLSAEFHLLLPSSIDMIKELLPQEDTRFDDLAARVLELVDAEGNLCAETDMEDLSARVTALQAHISETYRLHRRVIRHRRTGVLLDDEDSALFPYEVRGRTEPSPLAVESYDPAADSLVEWQTQLWGYLLDEGLEDNRDAYALVLAVLASRLGGTSADYIDALRWRVHRDEDAALRAGLSPRERHHLSAPSVAPLELKILEGLEEQITDDRHAAEINELVDALLRALRRGGRIIIFCGPGALASMLSERLSERFRQVDFFEHTRRVGAEKSEAAIAEWRQQTAKCAVLVADDTAEDGLNLQAANTVIHVRLPWSPNQLEQRLGRTDRYVESHQQRRPPEQFVVTDTEAHSGAWLSLLSNGYRIFADSVSTLQDAIAQGLAGVWAEALEHGPEGLTDSADAVQAQLADARAEIDHMDMLESVFEMSPGGDQFAERLGAFEADWEETRAAMLGYTGQDGSSGVQLRHSESSANRDAFEITQKTLISPHLYDRDQLTDEMGRGTFNRNEALKAAGTRLFRIGNPLVDTLANVVWYDDRGQATAFWRADRDHKGEPEPYFGFDYLVEADIELALELALQIPHVQKRAEAEAALRRQADQLLPPFTLKVWVPAGSTQALSDESTREWLDAPYGATDHNYNSKLIHELLDLFDGRPGYEASARAAEQVARAELERVTNLADRCAQAQEKGRERLAVAKAQAEARHAAGRLLGDRESYLLDVDVTEALVKGLSHPKVRLVSATCVLKTGLRRVRRGD